jgi:nicotinamide-nucleotide amidase
VFELVFTVLFVQRAVLENKLGEVAGGMNRYPYSAGKQILWRTQPREGRHLVVLSGEEEICRAVYAAIEKAFSVWLVREGDTTYLPEFLQKLRGAGLNLVTAESCTGGLIAKLITDAAGSSEVLWGSFVTYSNDAKMKCLGVSEETLKLHGAVSRETVQAMTEGALAASGAGAAVAVSGVAGPGGGTADKPVGTVWICVRLSGGAHREQRFLFSSRGREEVRVLSAYAALFLLESFIPQRDESIDINLPFDYI